VVGDNDKGITIEQGQEVGDCFHNSLCIPISDWVSELSTPSISY